MNIKRLFAIASFAFVVVFGGQIISSSDASAADIYNFNQAVTEINSLCNNAALTMAHAGYGSGRQQPDGSFRDVQLNFSTGVITYDLNILWKRCRAGNVSEYAITGYGGSCIPVGNYHDSQNYTDTRDCIKYTNRHAPGVARDCVSTGRPYGCIYTDVWLREGIQQGPQNYPASDTGFHYKVFYNRTGTIPNWNLLSVRRQGYANVYLDTLCDYYSSESSRVCNNTYVYVSWYNYELTPQISSFNNGDGIETPRNGLSVSGTVTNNDETNSLPNVPWRISQIVYRPGQTISNKGGGVSDQNTGPCQYFTGNIYCNDNVSSGSRMYPGKDFRTETGVASIADYPIGTQVCFVLSVRQYRYISNDTNNDPTENWRHSAMRCYIVGKKPKVNVLGSDLIVGRTLQGVPAPASARVLTSSTRLTSGTFGSWSEYAIIPSGPITNTTSGSASVNGRTTDVNLLSFANTGVVTATCGTSLGCYNHGASMPNVASRFKISSSSPVISSGSLNSRASGVYRATTNTLTINTSTIAEEKSIVINAPNTDVVIDGDITYAPGPFVRANQLPQVVIIARNITINESVENVDSWLIAPGTYSGGTRANGVIRTCNRPIAQISQDVCNNKLTVNGPVVANKLVMLRTFGATGANPGEPAEVFNLRADSYIWALRQGESSGKITTVSTKELPPRY